MLEAYGRRENLIFLNIAETQGEDCRAVLNSFLVSTGLKMAEENIMFQCVHRLGTAGKESNRPIIARFAFYPDRERIWNNKYMLKGTRYIIKEDYPLTMERRRMVLFPVMKRAKVLEKKATLRDDKLLVDGVLYTVNNVSALASAMNMQEISEVALDKHYLFGGQYSPLSNFTRSPIKLGGIQYPSTEHYFQAKKALFAGDTTTYKKILSAELPSEAKTLGKSVKCDKSRWSAAATQIMEKALTAKFTQHQHLRECLLATGDLNIVECSRDQVWGNGVPWNSEDAHDPNKWTGHNQLGILLTKLRDTLKKPSHQ